MAYGRSRYGGTLYAGEGEEALPPVPPSTSKSLSVSVPGAFGTGEWTAQIMSRGGETLRYEVPFSSLQANKVVNTFGQGQITIPNSGPERALCCEVFNSVEPFKDELVLWRGDDLAFAGPIRSMTVNQTGGTINAADLFYWMEVRFIEDDFHGDGDAADVFHDLFDRGYDPDPTPNISITTRQVGIQVTRDIKGSEFRRVADAMRELARTALDFCITGRTILAGGTEVFIDTTPLLLHDEGVLAAEVTRDGDNFATDIAVFGGSTASEFVQPNNNRVVFAEGRAKTGIERYGLVQRRFTELNIQDNISADANALARLRAMQPTPLRLKCAFSPYAAFGFLDLLPGKRADARLGEAAGCLEMVGDMRLQQVDISVNVGEDGQNESINGSFIPLGESDET